MYFDVCAFQQFHKLIYLRAITRSKTGAADKIAERTECLVAESCRVRTRQPEQFNSIRARDRRRVSNTRRCHLPFLTSWITSNPVQAAYMASLESQISSLRDELATVYKTQGQNAQRLLSMNETLREKEEASRVDTENLRKTKEEVASLRKKVEQHNELMAEKDRTAQVRFDAFDRVRSNRGESRQILHDEINTLQLELGQIEERSATLTKDNAKLLQRWLDAKQAEANKMNEANDFYEDMRSKHQDVLNWREGSQGDANSSVNNKDAESLSVSQGGSVSGNGSANEEGTTASTKDGTLSPSKAVVDLTPNG